MREEVANQSLIPSSVGTPFREFRSSRGSNLQIGEGLKLAAALFVAVFALVSGAKDQLLKLDLLPGLVAVFVIGFTADTVKNLLTQK